jgi:bifunctional non-homologous end joining protein LigD
MGLREYRQKRDFDRTPEPAGAVGTGKTPRKGKASSRPGYVIQKHAASRLHYDFRLEFDGVLKSWAVPKGPSLDPQEKRLAVEVEDHPIEYGGFEGVIPRGEYGGGTVMLWDRGWWEPVGDPAQGYAKGDFKFVLHGEKLQGRWVLVRLKRRERDKRDNWLLIKERDALAEPGSGDAIIQRETQSVASGREMKTIAADADRVWSSKTGEVTGKGPATSRQSAPADPSGLAGAKPARAAPAITPQLASPATRPPRGDDWLHEIKFDGYRMLAHVANGKTRLKSRKDLDWTRKFPELAEALARLPVSEALIDGEIVHLGKNGVSSFSALQNDLAEKTTARLVYMAFDLIFLDGWDLTGVALEKRKAMLRRLLAEDAPPTIRYCDHQAGHGEAFYNAASRYGVEGIVSKRRDAPYRPGRAADWLKLKSGKREDFVVVGFTDPEGARAGFGALLLAYHSLGGKLVYAGRVGTGFSDKVLGALRRRLEAIERKRAPVKLPEGLSAKGIHWVAPELVVEIAFAAWTHDRILRASSFEGLREDKSPEEVVLDPSPDGHDVEANMSTPTPRPPVARDGSAVVGGVRISNAERIVYPERGVTKQDVAQYYAEIAGFILPHVARRPLSLLRCPEGVTGERFFQKHMVGGGPAIKQIPIKTKEGNENYLMIEEEKGLLALVQMGVLEIHPWGSTVDRVEQPDRLIFDLDPDEDLPWHRVVAGALAVRDLLEKLGLRSFVKTTGGKGLHVVVPLTPALEWEAAKEFTRAVVTKLAGDEPHLYTASLAKQARRGRIFIDYLRNGRGATAVAAYSTRAKAEATVSAPLTWAEVENGVRSDQFTLLNLPQRLRSFDADPWGDIAAVKQKISAAALRRLPKL